MTGLRLGILRADYATCKYVDDFSILHFETHQLTSYDHDSHDELREIEERYSRTVLPFQCFPLFEQRYVFSGISSSQPEVVANKVPNIVRDMYGNDSNVVTWKGS